MSKLLVVSHALEMARVSKVTYEDFQSANQLFNELGYDQVQFIDVSGTQVYLLRKSGEIVISFRGTEPDELVDIMTDLRCKQVPFIFGSVHQGFLDALNLVYDPIINQLSQWYNGEKILFTGHSLGGALATLCASKIVHELKMQDFKVITFGCPRTGDKLFMEKYNELFLDKSIRVINDEDIVTKLPTNVFMKYYHVEDLYFIDDRFNFTDVPGWYPHIANLVEYVGDYLQIKADSENDALKKMARANLKELASDHSMDSYISSLEKCLERLKYRKPEAFL